MEHQFALFDHNTMRPKAKLPIKKKEVLEAKRLFESGNDKATAAKLRDIRERLEDFLDRMK